MNAKGLTARQERFVQEYLKDLNATAAAKRAGYKKPNQQGPRLLVNVGVAKAIKAGKQKRAEQAELTCNEVIGILRREATRTGKGSQHAARVRAAELLGKHKGMFPDRQEISGPQGKPIEHDYRNRNTLTPEDLDAADRISGMAGPRVHPDGGPQPVDSGQPTSPATSVPSPNGHT